MNWRPFDTKSFLKASKKWDDDIKKLENELENMSMLPSVDNKTGIRSGNISDLTQRMAIRRLEIIAEIEELKLNKEMLRYGLNMLPKDSRELIHGFFFSDTPKSIFAREYGMKHGICDTYVYEERDRVLKEMGRYIESEFYDD